MSLLVDIDSEGNLVFKEDEDSSVLALLSDFDHHHRRRRHERRGAIGGERVAQASDKSITDLAKRLTAANDTANKMQLKAAQAVQYWSDLSRTSKSERKLREIDLGTLRKSLASGTLGSDVLEIAQTVIDRFNDAQRIFFKACRNESGFLTQGTMASYFQNIRVVDSVMESLDASISAVSPLLQILASEVTQAHERETRLNQGLKTLNLETSETKEELVRLRRKYEELLRNSDARDARKLKKYKETIKKLLTRFDHDISLEEVHDTLINLPDMQNHILYLSGKKHDDNLSFDFRVHCDLLPPPPKLAFDATATAEFDLIESAPVNDFSLAIDQFRELAMDRKRVTSVLTQTEHIPTSPVKPELQTGEVQTDPWVLDVRKSPDVSLVPGKFPTVIEEIVREVVEPRRNFRLGEIQTAPVVSMPLGAFDEFLASVHTEGVRIESVQEPVVTLNAGMQTEKRISADSEVQTDRKISFDVGIRAVEEKKKTANVGTGVEISMVSEIVQTDPDSLVLDAAVSPVQMPSSPAVSVSVSPEPVTLGISSPSTLHFQLEPIEEDVEPRSLEISSSLGSVEISSRPTTRELRRGSGAVVIERPPSRPMSMEGERIFEFSQPAKKPMSKLEIDCMHFSSMVVIEAVPLPSSPPKAVVRTLSVGQSARVVVEGRKLKPRPKPKEKEQKIETSDEEDLEIEFILEGEGLSEIEKISANFGLDRGDLSPRSRTHTAVVLEKLLTMQKTPELSVKSRKVLDWIRIARPHISYLDLAELLVRVEQARSTKELDTEILNECDFLKSRLPGRVRELMNDKLRIHHDPLVTAGVHPRPLSPRLNPAGKLTGEATITQLIRQVENFQVRRDLYAAVQLLLNKEAPTECSVCQFCRRKTAKPPPTSSTVADRPTRELFQWTASSMLTRPDSMWTHSRPDTDGYGGLRRPPT